MTYWTYMLVGAFIDQHRKPQRGATPGHIGASAERPNVPLRHLSPERHRWKPILCMHHNGHSPWCPPCRMPSSLGRLLRCPPRCGPPHRGFLAVPSSLVPSSPGGSRWCLPRRCPPHGGVRCGALLVFALLIGASLRCPPRWCHPRRGVHGGAFLVVALLIGAPLRCPPRWCHPRRHSPRWHPRRWYLLMGCHTEAFIGRRRKPRCGRTPGRSGASAGRPGVPLQHLSPECHRQKPIPT